MHALKSIFVNPVRKDTTIIQFSLVSTDVMDTGWVVRPGTGDQHQAPQKYYPKRKRGQKRMKKRDKQISEIIPLQMETLERLRKVMNVLHAALKYMSVNFNNNFLGSTTNRKFGGESLQ